MIPSSNEDDSQIIMIQKMKLLLSSESTMPLDRVREAQRLLSFIANIFNSKATGEAFMYFLDQGAATAWILQVHLEMPQGTAYRVLKRLRAMGLIEEALILSNQMSSKGGPRTRMYALKGADSTEVAKAIRTHHRALSPKYRHAEKLIQSPLIVSRMDLLNEVKRTDLLEIAKEKLPGSMRVDVVQIAMEILVEQGVRVLR